MTHLDAVQHGGVGAAGAHRVKAALHRLHRLVHLLHLQAGGRGASEWGVSSVRHARWSRRASLTLQRGNAWQRQAVLRPHLTASTHVAEAPCPSTHRIFLHSDFHPCRRLHRRRRPAHRRPEVGERVWAARSFQKRAFRHEIPYPKQQETSARPAAALTSASGLRSAARLPGSRLIA